MSSHILSLVADHAALTASRTDAVTIACSCGAMRRTYATTDEAIAEWSAHAVRASYAAQFTEAPSKRVRYACTFTAPNGRVVTRDVDSASNYVGDIEAATVAAGIDPASVLTYQPI